MARVFTEEGDSFEGFLFDWAPVKEFILKEIYKGVKELETFDVLDVRGDILWKVACTVTVTEKMGIKGEWINKVIGESMQKETTLLCSKRIDRSLLNSKSCRSRWVGRSKGFQNL